MMIVIVVFKFFQNRQETRILDNYSDNVYREHGNGFLDQLHNLYSAQIFGWFLMLHSYPAFLFVVTIYRYNKYAVNRSTLLG